jgi:hypothetical protein
MKTSADGGRGVGEKTIQAIEAARGRVPEAWILESIANALRVDPAVFYEYPIAVARRDGKRARPDEVDDALGDAVSASAGLRRGRGPGST